jgi:hypothetical protein
MRLLRDSRSDVYGYAADLLIHDLALTGVQARADLKPQLAHSVAYRTRALDSAGRSVESGEETITRHIELSAAEANELAPNERMMAL